MIGQSPLVADRDLLLAVPAGDEAAAGLHRVSCAPQIDAQHSRIAIVETWTGTGTAMSSTVVWASFDGPSPEILARGALDLSTWDAPLPNGDQLILFGSSGAVFYEADNGALRAVARRDDARGFTPLGIDGTDRIYVALRSPASELVVLDARDGSVRSDTPLPDVVRTAIGLGDRLLLSGSHSVSLIEPSCGATPDAGSESTDAGPDASAPDAATKCGPVVSCPSGGLVRGTLPGDVNGDGCVDQADVSIALSCVGQAVTDSCSLSFLVDFDGDGKVGTSDYLKVVRNQGKGCDAGQ
jgi:hypothetical protein